MFNKVMNIRLVWATILVLNVVFVVIISKVFYDKYEYATKSALTENQSYKIKENRIECMTKTLMMAYGLSKWESHYYSIIFDDFATYDSIPWEVFPAIIRIESNFNGTVVSTKGAKGMMQMLESTAKPIAERLEINYISQQTLWNDIINLILGCQYLSDAIKQKGLKDGIKIYLGGPDYEKSIKYSGAAKQYIGEYHSTVWKEYKTLVYMYRGIVQETGYDYDKIHSINFKDTLVNINLFK